MIQVKIADQSLPFHEANFEWIRSTINKNHVMGKENRVEIDIDSDNAKLKLLANCGQATDLKPTNDFESRIIFLWQELVLNKVDIDPFALHDFLKRMERWVSFVPKA